MKINIPKESLDPNVPMLGACLAELIPGAKYRMTDSWENFIRTYGEENNGATPSVTWNDVMAKWADLYNSAPTLAEVTRRSLLRSVLDYMNEYGYEDGAIKHLTSIYVRREYDGVVLPTQLESDIKAVMEWSDKLVKEAATNGSTPDFESITKPRQYMDIIADLVAL